MTNYFNSLLTKSINENRDQFLLLLPEFILNETQKAALDYVKQYQDDHGVMPTIERFEKSEFGIMVNQQITSSPFTDLIKLTLQELKANFLLAEFNRFEAASMRKEVDAESIMVSAAEKIANISVNEVNDAEDVQFPLFGKFYGTGLNSGIPYIDEAIGGLIPGKFNLIFAPLGSGKTYLLTYIATYNLLMGKKVLVVRGEMGEDEYIARLMGIACNFNADEAIRAANKDANKAADLDDLCKKFLAHIKTLGGGLYFTKDPMPYVSQIKQAYRRVQPDIVLIDGLYTLPAKGRFSQEHEREGSISNQVRDFAKKGVTINGERFYPRIVGTTQMNREGMKLSAPSNDTIGGSIKYGQDADNVFSLKLNSTFAGNAEYDLRQTKGRGNSPVAGIMEIDWKNMRFGFNSSDYPKLATKDGLSICGFNVAML